MNWKLSWRLAVVAMVLLANIFAIVDTSEAGRRCRRRRGGCGSSCGYSSCNYNYNNCQNGGCGTQMQYAPGEPMPAPPAMNQQAPPQAMMNGTQQQYRQQSGYRGVESGGNQSDNRRVMEQQSPRPSLPPANELPSGQPAQGNNGASSTNLPAPSF
jgi:hypothetical protein